MAKIYEVKMEIEAPNAEVLDKWFDRMPHCENIYNLDIIDPDEPKLEGRIRYDEDWNGHGEHFVFENKWTNEDEWGFECAFPLNDDCIHYTALTKVREWKRLGINFRFK